MPGPAHDDAAGPPDATPSKGRATKALDMMVEALRLIDLDGSAGVAGAHLDLAIHRLREWIEEDESK